MLQLILKPKLILLVVAVQQMSFLGSQAQELAHVFFQMQSVIPLVKNVSFVGLPLILKQH